jgi:hypothetical protein
MVTTGVPGTAPEASPRPARVDIAIVGGGISGLYCALELARCIEARQPLFIGGRQVDYDIAVPTIALYEMRGFFGGRIETWTLDLNPHGADVATVSDPYDPAIDAEQKASFYRAEFGPMRIEPRDQPRLASLLDDLDIREPSRRQPQDGDLIKFPAYVSEAPTEPKYSLVGEEADQHSLLDLLLLAVRRILELVDEAGRHAGGPPVAWASAPARANWGHFLGGSSVRRQYWKGELHDFIVSLDDSDYDVIRRQVCVNGTRLCDMGFWNLLSEVLSHLAVLRIRDWGSYYHLIGENPNAAEHLIMWLRAIKSSESLRGIRGGMGLIVHRLVNRLRSAPCSDHVTLHPNHTLASLNPAREPHGGVTLDFANGTSIVADEVILAMPKRPLERLNLPRLAHELDKVQDIPLLKVFFVIDQPWWEDDRPPNRFAADLPTREVHYWKSADKTRGVMMVYTDRPALHFWSDYLGPEDRGAGESGGTGRAGAAAGTDSASGADDDDGLAREQQTASIWILKRTADRTAPEGINRRLWRRFVQYARDYEHNDFTMERLLACGIRDWGKDPYGAAVHVWRPRARSWEVAARFAAFSLDGGSENVHICGDAYSDYQGFIEGALRSADRVLGVLRSGDTHAPAPTAVVPQS